MLHGNHLKSHQCGIETDQLEYYVESGLALNRTSVELKHKEIELRNRTETALKSHQCGIETPS